jgi:hypothetical protein
MCRLAEEQHASAGRPLETEHETDEGRLAAAVGARDRNELALRYGHVHVAQHGIPVPVREIDGAKLDR